MKSGVTLLKGALTKVINSYTAEMGGTPGGKLVIMGSVRPAYRRRVKHLKRASV